MKTMRSMKNMTGLKSMKSMKIMKSVFTIVDSSNKPVKLSPFLKKIYKKYGITL